MIYESETIRAILTSPAGRRMLDAISPIYGDAAHFLRILNAIGGQLDELCAWSEQMWSEIVPQTATWSLPLWEAEYAIEPNEALTAAQRRDRLLARMKKNTAMNRYRLEQILSSFTGARVVIRERTGKNQFSVFVQTPGFDREAELVRLIERFKPAHLIYAVLYEQFTQGTQHWGGVVSTGFRQTLLQAN